MSAPQVAFDRNGRAYLFEDGRFRPYQPTKYPLASREGLAVLEATLHCSKAWSALTVPQRHALAAEAGSARPMAKLRAVELLDADGRRTDRGEVLVRWARGAGELPPLNGDAA